MDLSALKNSLVKSPATTIVGATTLLVVVPIAATLIAALVAGLAISAIITCSIVVATIGLVFFAGWKLPGNTPKPSSSQTGEGAAASPKSEPAPEPEQQEEQQEEEEQAEEQQQQEQKKTLTHEEALEAVRVWRLEHPEYNNS